MFMSGAVSPILTHQKQGRYLDLMVLGFMAACSWHFDENEFCARVCCGKKIERSRRFST
jgi:hypothetical protein